MRQLNRALRLDEIKNLLSEGARLSLDRIVSEYGISRKTAARDINFVGEMGVELKTEETQLGKVWFASTRSRKISVSYSIEDVMALFMGRKLFDFLANTSFEDSINRVYTRIEAQLCKQKDLDNANKLSQKIFLIHEGPKKLNARSSEILDDCLTSLLYENKLKICYKNAKNRISKTIVHPYTIAIYKRGLYLLAASETRGGEVRVFSIDRITSAKWLKEDNYVYPVSWNPEDFFKNAFCIVNGTPEKVVIGFSKGSAPFIKGRKFHPSQRIRKQADGTIKMTLKVPVNFELVNWILSFGPHVEVLSPDKLRQDIAGQLQAALSQYSIGPSSKEETIGHIIDGTHQMDLLTGDLFAGLDGEY